MTDAVRQTYGLQRGTIDLQSIGPIAFGPESILFVADNRSATIFAIDVEPWNEASVQVEPVAIEHLDAHLAAYLGCLREDVHIRDLAVRPTSQQMYLSVMRGSGDSAVPLLLTLASGGEISEILLQDVRFACSSLEDAPPA